MKKLLQLSLFFTLPISLLGQVNPATSGFIAQKYWKVADSLLSMRQFEKAIEVEEMALKILKSRKKMPHDSIGTSLLRVGIKYRNAGNIQKCRHFYETALDYANTHIPNNLILAGSIQNSLGVFHLIQGNNTKAEGHFVASLNLRNLANDTLSMLQCYQNLALVCQIRDEYDAALDYSFNGLAVCKKIYRIHPRNFIGFYEKIGTSYHYSGALEEAVIYYDSMQLIMDAHYPPNHGDYGGLYNNMAKAFVDKGDYLNAKEYYRKAIENYHQNPSGDQHNLAKIYSSFGFYLYESGDYNRALVYFQKALDLRKELYKDNPNHFLIARIKNQIGNTYLQKNNLEEAERWLMEALEIRKNNAKSSPADLADSYQDVGKYYEESGYWKRALEEYYKAIDLNIKVLKEEHTSLADNYFLVGSLYLKQKKIEEAREWFQKSLKIYQNKFGEIHPKIAEIYSKLAMTFPNNEIKTEDYLKRAFHSVGYANSATLQSVSSPRILLEILKTKGELALDFALQNDDLEKLQNAASDATMAIQLIDTLKISFQDPGSKQALLDNFFKVYENAIEANFQLKNNTGDKKYWERAFEIAEKSNSTLLIEALNTLDAEAFAGIPENLLEKERNLKLAIGYREKLRFEEEQKGTKADREKIKNWSAELFDLKQEHQEVIQIFVDSFPNYYHLKYADKSLSVNTLQQEVLTKNQAMLEYFVGDEQIFLFVITKDDFEVIPIAKDFPFEIWVEELRTGIYFYHPARTDAKFLIQKYANIANELYEILVKPAEKWIAEKDLVIVPGGILGYLPFEALLTESTSPETSFKKFPYLLRKHAISYNYSAILWFELNQPNHKHASQNFLGIAPFFTGDVEVATRQGKLGKLHFNKKEVQLIQELLGGKIFTDSLATVEHFLENAHLFRILHLATHGIANDQIGDYSYLAFYQIPDSLGVDLLYVKDIYNLNLNAEMVALSACETAIGEYQRGEGIVSLARGFFYAGAESILTTLWKLDDKASLLLMENFYTNYKNGMTKDAALREAKLQYISEKENFHAHPLYWAAFVPVGDMAAFEGTVGSGAWIWGLMVLGVVLLGWILWRKLR